MEAAIWTDEDGTVFVPLELLDPRRIKTEARRRHEYWVTRPNARYRRRSTVEGQEVGVIGEDAVATWLRAIGMQIRMIADDPASRREALGDVAVAVPNTWPPSERTVEVKTQRNRDWRRGGPVIDGAQLFQYDIPIAWCVVSDDPWSKPVRIIGWFHPAAVRSQMSEHLFDETFGNDGIQVWPMANQPRQLVELLRAPEHGRPAN